ncbi:hypothetical protein JF544_00495 [Halobacillus kuroshimensis]|uniref:YfhD family protein n=1 Tax=Halobacillus kuroshimensis TaxID=302481 RepID=A0ABS3DQT8_9BACI|nr:MULTISPECIES: hypothetical protein [Halobacillus]MBN8233699.1 hypothetical protein [Halobacillus kuroshimensis]
MEQRKQDSRKDNSRVEVETFDESIMEPQRLTDADRKQMETDRHTVGGF